MINEPSSTPAPQSPDFPKPPQPQPVSPKQGAEPFHQTVKSSVDPWQQLLGPTATPKEVAQFKVGVIKMINSQIEQEQKQMLKSLKKLRREYS